MNKQTKETEFHAEPISWVAGGAFPVYLATEDIDELTEFVHGLGHQVFYILGQEKDTIQNTVKITHGTKTVNKTYIRPKIFKAVKNIFGRI